MVRRQEPRIRRDQDKRASIQRVSGYTWLGLKGFRRVRPQAINVRMVPGYAVSEVMVSGRNALPTLPLESRSTSEASYTSDAQDAQDTKNNFC